MFPEDFDGILIGAPAYAWANLTGFQIHVNLFQSDATSPSYITAANFVFIADQVTKACDTLDNVPDGIISNPRKCNFDTNTLLCSNFPNGTVGCLTPAQVTTLNNIYQDWTEKGQYIFPSFEHGSESMFPMTLSGFLWPLFTEYFALSVLNVSLTTFDPSTVNLDVITLADKINPGGIIADNPDLRPYFSRGGKIIVRPLPPPLTQALPRLGRWPNPHTHFSRLLQFCTPQNRRCFK
jgi:feruloyl esterase